MFDLVLQFLDGTLDWAIKLGENGNGDDVSGDTASTAEVSLLSNVDVWHVLIFAQERQVEDDLKWFGIGGDDHEVGNTSVEGLGSLIGTLLQKFEILSLVEQIKDLFSNLVVSLWPGSLLLNSFFFVL